MPRITSKPLANTMRRWPAALGTHHWQFVAAPSQLGERPARVRQGQARSICSDDRNSPRADRRIASSARSGSRRCSSRLRTRRRRTCRPSPGEVVDAHSHLSTSSPAPRRAMRSRPPFSRPGVAERGRAPCARSPAASPSPRGRRRRWPRPRRRRGAPARRRGSRRTSDVEAALAPHVRPRHLLDDRPQVEPAGVTAGRELDRVVPERVGVDRLRQLAGRWSRHQTLDERHLEHLLVHDRPVAEVALLAEQLAVVGGDDHPGVRRAAGRTAARTHRRRSSSPRSGAPAARAASPGRRTPSRRLLVRSSRRLKTPWTPEIRGHSLGSSSGGA